MIVYLDTNIVIYAVENPPTWGARALAHLTSLRSAGTAIMVSDLTRMESLVGPFKSGDKAVENNFRSFFGASDVQVACINAAVCERAAEIRAKFNWV
jgi:predicted nucleic acid-binding protein